MKKKIGVADAGVRGPVTSAAESTSSGLAKPDCYACVHRRTVPGSCHSACAHPTAITGKVATNPLAELFAMLGGGRGGVVVDVDAAGVLGIEANRHGVRSGWFNWPFNFDPVWLEACKGFIPKPKPAEGTV